jgi:hypothetical protein
VRVATVGYSPERFFGLGRGRSGIQLGVADGERNLAIKKDRSSLSIVKRLSILR